MAAEPKEPEDTKDEKDEGGIGCLVLMLAAVCVLANPRCVLLFGLFTVALCLCQILYEYLLRK